MLIQQSYQMLDKHNQAFDPLSRKINLQIKVLNLDLRQSPNSITLRSSKGSTNLQVDSVEEMDASLLSSIK